MKTPLEKIRENLNPGDRDEWAEDQVVAPLVNLGCELIGYSHTDPIGKEESGVHIFVFHHHGMDSDEEIQAILGKAADIHDSSEYLFSYDELFVFFTYYS